MGEIIEANGVDFQKDFVPVQWRFSDKLRDQMGYATIERVGNEFFADIKFFPDWSQDLESIKLMTPAVGGVLITRDGPRLTNTKINRIGLSTDPNSDPRIKSINSQYEEAKTAL